MAALYVQLRRPDYIVLRRSTRLDIGESDARRYPCCRVSREGRAAAFSLRKTAIDAFSLHYTCRENALVFTAGANGNNSRADEHSNKDCAKNEVVRHNGGPFGGLCCSVARERMIRTI